jgi:hypothetical protein
LSLLDEHPSSREHDPCDERRQAEEQQELIQYSGGHGTLPCTAPPQAPHASALPYLGQKKAGEVPLDMRANAAETPMLEKQKISLVLADVDGTLVTEEKVLTKRALGRRGRSPCGSETPKDSTGSNVDRWKMSRDR